MTGVPVVGRADLQGLTQVDNHDEPILSGRCSPWLHADSALCVTGTSADSAQPTPFVFEAVQVIGDRDVVGTHDASEAEPTCLGARHNRRFAVLAMEWTLTMAQWHPAIDPVYRTRVFRHAKMLHQRNTILSMSPMWRQTTLCPAIARARQTDYSAFATESEDEHPPTRDLQIF